MPGGPNDPPLAGKRRKKTVAGTRVIVLISVIVFSYSIVIHIVYTNLLNTFGVKVI